MVREKDSCYVEVLVLARAGAAYTAAYTGMSWLSEELRAVGAVWLP